MTNILIIVTRLVKPAASVVSRVLVHKSIFPKFGYNVVYISQGVPLIDCLRKSNHLFLRLIGKALTRMPWVKGRENWIYVFLSWLNAKRIVKKSKNFDIIYIEKYAPLWLVREIINIEKSKVIFDLNDGIWLPNFLPQIRNDIFLILSEVDAVTTDNQYMVEKAKEFNKNVFYTPPVTNLEKFEKYTKNINRDGKNFVIGWLGSNSTVHYLSTIIDELESILSENKNIEIIILGAEPSDLPTLSNGKTTFIKNYDEEIMISEVSKMDVGLMPLKDNKDAYTRGYGKATIYMAAGAIPVCSNIGTIKKIINQWENGVLIENKEEWVSSILGIYKDKDLMKKMRNNVLEYVNKNFTHQMCFEKLDYAFQSVLNNK